MLTITQLSCVEPRRISDGHILNYRRDLCAKRCTLNGRPAQVGGAANPFATVRDLETGLGADWAWPTVERILAAGGKFSTL